MLDLFSAEAVLKDAMSVEYYNHTRWAYLGRQRELPGTRRIRFITFVGDKPGDNQEKYDNEIWEFDAEWQKKATQFATWAQRQYVDVALARIRATARSAENPDTAL
jgi:hypothetical protein